MNIQNTIFKYTYKCSTLCQAGMSWSEALAGSDDELRTDVCLALGEVLYPARLLPVPFL